MQAIIRPLFLVAALGVVAPLAGCERGEVRDELREMEDAKRKIERGVKAKLDDAKEEARQLKDQLPAVDTVKEELAEAGAEAKEALLRVGERVKRQATDLKDELKDAVRDRLADAD